MSFPLVPSRLYGFTRLSLDDFPEYRSQGILFVHKRTQAHVYHMRTNDRENLAAFMFPTPPTDDSGLPHILEHLVLCGSRKYPTKDPFLYLLRSSLHTFLNAMTYPDKTIYPLASVVPKDFYNLFRVYADAVFFPLLRPQAFAQEAYRLQWGDEGGLTYSGVVYNEMKGDYSSAESRIATEVGRSVFDQGPYTKDSGGRPREIVQLAYQDLVDFHRTHYHPSQALIFLYGDQDTQTTLKILDRDIFRHFSASRPPSDLISCQPRWNQPRFMRSYYPANPEQDNPGTIAMSWLCADILEHERVLVLGVLAEVLLGDAGLLQKALLESGLGEDISPTSGLGSDLRDVTLTVGLRGVAEDKREVFERLVREELQKIVDAGIPQDLLESIIIINEFSVREIKGGNNGLRFLRRLSCSWIHGASPHEVLSFSRRMERLKSRLATGEKVFENLIQEALLDNPHCATVVCLPDATLQQKEDEEIQEDLAKIRIKASAEQLKRIKKAHQDFEVFQATADRPRDIAKLPRLRLQDIPPKIETIDAQWLEGITPLVIHEAFTNGIFYADIAFDISSLTQEEIRLLPLLQRVLASLGLHDLSWDLLAREIALKTGGIAFHFSYDSPVSSIKEVKPVAKFWVRFKMLENNMDHALDLVERILTKTDWSNILRMKDLLLEARNDFQSSLIPRGHLFAALWTARLFSRSTYVAELTSGLSQLDFLNKLVVSCEKEEQLAQLLERLRHLAAKVFQSQDVCASLTGSGAALKVFAQGVRRLVLALPSWSQTVLAWSPEPVFPGFFLRPISSTVGFNAYTIPSLSLSDRLYPSELFLCQRLKTGLLWETIRVKGGSYGAFAFSNGLEGCFTFATYRDPNLNLSFDAFRQGLQEVLECPLSKTEQNNIVIGTLGNDLSPRSPAEEGFLFLYRALLGVSEELRQFRRDALLRLQSSTVHQVARRLLDAFDQGVGLSLTSESIAEMGIKENRRKFQFIVDRGD